LNLALDIVDRVGRLDLKGNGFTREGLDEDLHIEDLEFYEDKVRWGFQVGQRGRSIDTGSSLRDRKNSTGS
jgi:hypothetical protein